LRKCGFNRVPKQSLSVYLFGVIILEQPTCLPILFSMHEQNILKLIFTMFKIEFSKKKKKKLALSFLST